MLLEEAILAHYDMGHNFEVLKIAETPNRVTYNIAQHGVNWKPTKAVVDKINKLFHTFRFTTTGRMYAQRGREFARDAEVLTKMLKEYEINNDEPLEGGTHRENFLKDHKLEDKGYSLDELSKISYVPLETLQEVYNRGIGAYKTQPSSVRLKGSYVKGVKAPMSAKLSKEQWAMARVYSFLDGNPKHDEDLRKGGSTDLRKYVLSKHLTTHPEFAAHYPAYAMNLQRHKEAQAEAKERATAKKQAMAQRQPSVRTTAVIRPMDQR